MAQVVPWAFTSLVESRDLAARAALLAVAFRPPVYDCMYLALAEDRDALLVTADDRLRKAVQGTAWERRVQALTVRARSQ